MIAIMIPTPIMTRLLLFMAFSLKRRLPQTPAPSNAGSLKRQDFTNPVRAASGHEF